MTDWRSLMQLDDYATLLTTLKERIRSVQLRAAVAVNQRLILLYWSIGRDILACDLRRNLPEIIGLSPWNLTYMRAFTAVYPDQQIVQQVVAQIPWGHNLRLQDFLKTPDYRLWYARQANKHGWRQTVIPFGVSLVQR